MSQLVKTKRQANFKDFKRFGAIKELVEQKNVVFNSFVCKLGFFWHSWTTIFPISVSQRAICDNENSYTMINFIASVLVIIEYGVRLVNFCVKCDVI
jgi:hypothetical protein